MTAGGERSARSQRDRLIGAAAAVFGFGTLAFAVLNARAVYWGELTGSSRFMATVLLAGRLIEAGAFLYLAVAFSGTEQARDRRVRLGARVLLLALAAQFLASVYSLVIFDGRQFPMRGFWALLILPLCGYVPWMVAAALIASAFASRDRRRSGEGATARSRLLAWAGVCVALAWALVLASRFVGSWGWSWPGLGDRFEIADTAGLVGDVLFVVAPALAAIGFFVFLRAGRLRSVEPLLLRETWLERSAGLLFLAGSLAVVESAVLLWSTMSEGWDWRYSVFLWELLLDVRWAVAALLLVIAFAASRRALPRRG